MCTIQSKANKQQYADLHIFSQQFFPENEPNGNWELSNFADVVREFFFTQEDGTLYPDDTSKFSDKCLTKIRLFLLIWLVVNYEQTESGAEVMP